MSALDLGRDRALRGPAVSADPESSRSPAPMPVRIVEIELSQPLPAIVAIDQATGQRFRHALCLVRLRAQPVGIVELRWEGDGISPAASARQIWSALRDAIEDRVATLGGPSLRELTGAGIDLPAAAVSPDRQAAEPAVTVIVATRDRPQSLDACLTSLLALDYPKFDLVVVDSAPGSSASADLLRDSYGHLPHVRYVRESRPGLAVAHNRGLIGVESPIVAFTDDDVTVDRHWLRALAHGFASAEDVGCVTGMIMPAELDTQAQLWLEQFAGFGKGFATRIFDLNGNRPDNPLFPFTAGMFGSGANMAFRTDALRAIGGFDDALGAGTKALGGDDLAAFFEVIMHGYKLVYEPAAIIRHRHHREYAALRRCVFGYGAGLTAFLTKCVLDRPRLLADIAIRLPRGLAHLRDPQSSKNNRKQADFPSELTSLERRGMAYGPVAYLRSRWHAARLDRRRTKIATGATMVHQ